MLTLREDKDIDAEALGALFRAVGFSRPTDAATTRAMLDGTRFVVSAWDGDALVGFARAISDGVTNAYISTVAVAPSHQRRGIGRALLQRLIADKPTIKFVLHTSEAGRALYTGAGFVERPGFLVRDRAQ